MKTDTGEDLNWLNGKTGIGAPENSVPVMSLIRKHKPKSHEELYFLIKKHSQTKCKCGIISKGTIEDFGKKLYLAQQKYWKQKKHSLKQCIKWEYDLFIVQSMKGQCMEEKVKQILTNKLTNKYNIIESNDYIDDTLRVDLEIKHKNKTVCGIQVKPISYKKTRKTIKEFNKKSNQKYNKTVFYIYYEYETEKILNIDKVVKKILEV
jgi:hypothetical protein